jgi:hypothetical protein
MTIPPKAKVDPDVKAGEEAARVAAEKGASLRAELAALPLGQLKKRAQADAVDEEAVDDVDDADDPKSAIIELLVDAAAKAEELAWAAAAEEAARVSAAEAEAARGKTAEEAAARANGEPHINLKFTGLTQNLGQL